MHKTFDFVGKFKFAILLPVVVFITGIIFNVFVGADLSIDFKGGTTISYSYVEDIDFEKVKKTAENALKDVSKETVITAEYTGALDTSAVTSTLNAEKIEGFDFSVEKATKDGASIIEISANGKEFLKKEQIDLIANSLTKNYSANKPTVKSYINNEYSDIKLEVSSSANLTSGDKSIKVDVIGNTALNTIQLEKIETSLQETFKDNNIKEVNVNSVNENFGSAFFGKAIFAVLLASALVIIYVGFRFKKVGGIKAGLTALAALVHDILFIYFINVIFGITIDVNFIAVFLTVLGYSLNDTIVIYDRIRENAGIYGNKKSIRELANLSVSQSFKRTCVTSITTFLAIMSVNVVAAIYGLDSILTFSIPMSIGTICGTYSSLFIASPLYVFWCERSEKKSSASKTNRGTKKSGSYTNKINPKGKKKKSY